MIEKTYEGFIDKIKGYITPKPKMSEEEIKEKIIKFFNTPLDDLRSILYDIGDYMIVVPDHHGSISNKNCWTEDGLFRYTLKTNIKDYTFYVKNDRFNLFKDVDGCPVSIISQHLYNKIDEMKYITFEIEFIIEDDINDKKIKSIIRETAERINDFLEFSEFEVEFWPKQIGVKNNKAKMMFHLPELSLLDILR